MRSIITSGKNFTGMLKMRIPSEGM
ncbi:hypothetical protein LINPERHAP1_LOCUS12985 [Linum perenne]